MSKINTPPVGLQSLLGSQSFGDNPNDLLEQVRPIVDLTPFWGSNKLEVQWSSGNRAAPGNITSFAYDANFTRMLLGVSIYAPTPTAGTFRTAAYLNKANGLPSNQIHLIHTDDPVTIIANDEYGWSFWLPQPVLLEPGIGLLFRSLQQTANATFNCTAIFYRLES